MSLLQPNSAKILPVKHFVHLASKTNIILCSVPYRYDNLAHLTTNIFETNQWSKCSSNCIDGRRNRYRFCDSPPPQYGTKFCEGKFLESERCGNETGWKCQLFQWNNEPIDKLIPAELPEVKEEIGSGCRCGCIVHLGVAKPRRMLATSTQSCPGPKPTLWLIKVKPSTHIM
ncbi:netrin receptor UNC5D-like [Diaphorina citri]|uniref:Netrin receptor UNC5D-like n=1 Tax=Diaphorina citri TaxID=121845 RepID=A0A1S3DJR8_DIACI|nr:netrin receptor UNC5D-like [Diaphorina citri]